MTRRKAKTPRRRAKQAPPPSGYLSIRAYARHRKDLRLPGHSVWSVQKAIRDGRITYDPDVGIDATRADAEWEANTDSLKGPPAAESTSGVAARTLQEARAAREAFRARREELNYKREAGLLIPKTEVERQAFNTYRVVRERLFAIPDQLGPDLAAEANPRKCITMVKAAIREALESLAGGTVE